MEMKKSNEKGKKVTPKFLLVLLILGMLLMFSSSFFSSKKEVPVFKEQKTQNQEKDVPTFGQKIMIICQM